MQQDAFVFLVSMLCVCRHEEKSHHIKHIKHFVNSALRTASHDCLVPLNQRFGPSPPLPSTGMPAATIATIRGALIKVYGKGDIKHLPLEVNDITFLGSDPSLPSPSALRVFSCRFTSSDLTFFFKGNADVGLSPIGGRQECQANDWEQ